MADWFGAAGSLIGGIGSFLSGNAEAKGAEQAAAYYGRAAQLSEQEAGIKQLQLARSIYQVQGTGEANAAAGGLAMSGSAADVLRSNAQQGALDSALLAQQGNIQASAYRGQAASAAAAASASKSKGKGGLVGGLVNAGAAIAFSDDALKEDVILVARRPDGIGLYHFRYKGCDTVWEGVMASEVKLLANYAYHVDDTGYAMVDYDAIGAELKKVA